MGNKLFPALVLLLCLVNIYMWPMVYEEAFFWPEYLRTEVPGWRMAPFKEHLKGVRVVGYCTDRYHPGAWYQPEFATYIQRYQYTLSPVQMDWEGRYTHDLIIFDCRNEGCQKNDVTRLRLLPVAAIGKNLLLMRKK